MTEGVVEAGLVSAQLGDLLPLGPVGDEDVDRAGMDDPIVAVGGGGDERAAPDCQLFAEMIVVVVVFVDVAGHQPGLLRPLGRADTIDAVGSGQPSWAKPRMASHGDDRGIIRRIPPRGAFRRLDAGIFAVDAVGLGGGQLAAQGAYLWTMRLTGSGRRVPTVRIEPSGQIATSVHSSICGAGSNAVQTTSPAASYLRSQAR